MKPYPNPGGRPGFRAIFRHPVTGKNSTFGLATTDAETAATYCQKLQMFCDDPSLLKDPLSPRMAAFPRRVREIIFGEAAAAKLDGLEESPRLADEDVDELEVAVTAIIDRARNKEQLRKAIVTALREFQSQRYKELFDEFKRLETKLQDKTSRVEDLENEMAKLRRATNANVKGTVADAYDAWKGTNDFKALAPKTQQEVGFACDSFLKTLPEKLKLADLRAQHVTAWLNGLKSKDGTRDLSAVTRAKMKRYVSVFIGYTYREKDLAENPMAKTGSVKGAARAKDDVEAITRETDFTEMLKALETVKPAAGSSVDMDYWRAVVATATLTGPRYAELVWLKLDDVNLESNTIFIGKREGVNGVVTGTKTGKSRNAPIESTVLRAILESHIERRKAEQKRSDATPAQKSRFLFPSLVAENPYKPRTLTPAGLWSDNGVFADAWSEVRTLCEAATGKRFYWHYGPRQWRHCAGTAMAHSGIDTWQVSDWLGTSEKMVEDHYRGKSTQGKKWGFKW